jgi:AmiR/NasT family two-component response regulator
VDKGGPRPYHIQGAFDAFEIFGTTLLLGLSDPQHARRALQEGFEVCMVKPLDLGRQIEYVPSAVRRIAEQSKVKTGLRSVMKILQTFIGAIFWSALS